MPGAAVLLPPEVITPALQEAAATAMQGYPSIARARAKQAARKSVLRGANWQRFPNLTVDALALRGGNQFSNDDGLIANVVVEQPL